MLTFKTLFSLGICAVTIPLVGMEPPHKKQKIAEKQLFEHFEHLPLEIQEQVILKIINTPSLEQAAEAIRSMIRTNKEWRTILNSELITKKVIHKLSERFDITELLVALYIGTPEAIMYINQQLADENKRMDIVCCYALQELLHNYTDANHVEKIVKQLLTINPDAPLQLQRVRKNSDGNIVFIQTKERSNGFLTSIDAEIATIRPDGTPYTSFKPIPITVLQPEAFHVSKLLVRNNSITLLLESMIESSIVRYTLDGALDQAFGNHGNNGVINTNEKFTSLEIMPNDSLVVCTNAGKMERMNTHGGPLNFSVAFGHFNIIPEVTDIQYHDNALYVAGMGKRRGQKVIFVIKYYPNLKIDQTFGTNGIKVIDAPGTMTNPITVSIEHNGRIIVAGIVLHGHQKRFIVEVLE